ncbi:MAG: tetratricopeptide repeat protein [Candidatus Obscuribacterales bacterium]|nr:tetratricopeptide repeat protein [Candidatus Obscuribacterales bacterium]
MFGGYTLAKDVALKKHLDRARACNFSLEQSQDAVNEYTKAIELDPKNSMIFTKRAYYYIRLKQYRKAIDDSTRAIELDKRNGWAFDNRAWTYYFGCF